MSVVLRTSSYTMYVCCHYFAVGVVTETRKHDNVTAKEKKKYIVTKWFQGLSCAGNLGTFKASMMDLLGFFFFLFFCFCIIAGQTPAHMDCLLSSTHVQYPNLFFVLSLF